MNENKQCTAYDVLCTTTSNDKIKTSRTSYMIHRTLFIIAIAMITSLIGCKAYKFNDVSFPPEIKTVKINFLENKATYVNPQLSPRLTDRLRQKIVSQTKLSQTNNDNADWVLSGYISNYTVSTSGISQKNTSLNRLTVGVHITILDQVNNKSTDYDVSRNFDFNAQLSIQQAEANEGENILRSLTDDIFNKIFSTW